MNEKKWLKIWFFIIMIIPMVGIFNYYINPFGFINFYNTKPKVENTKYTIRYKMPILGKGIYTSIMLGTSRIGVMNPDIVDLILKNTKTFNLSQPGSALLIQYDSFKYAIQYNNISTLIYGVDFLSFNKNRRLNPDYIELKDKIQSYDKLYNFDILFTTNYTLESIKYIFKKIQNKNLKKIVYYDAKNGMRHYDKYIYDDNLDLEKNINNSIKSYYRNNGVYNNYEFSYEYLKMFKNIIDICRNKNIKVYIYIPPLYSKHFNALKSANLLDEYLLFLKELSKTTSFIDFNYNNSITIDKTNFWDSSHLREELTNTVMQKILVSLDKKPYDFGRIVTSENIDEHILFIKKNINRD